MIIVDYMIDDDENNESNGNGDGLVNCGEDIEPYVTIRNQGNVTALDINGGCPE